MPVAFGTSQHWRTRAGEARILAEGMTDETAKRAMLDIAENYEKIAERAEARKEASPSG
jgi:hypothetical protein